MGLAQADILVEMEGRDLRPVDVRRGHEMASTSNWLAPVATMMVASPIPASASRIAAAPSAAAWTPRICLSGTIRRSIILILNRQFAQNVGKFLHLSLGKAETKGNSYFEPFAFRNSPAPSGCAPPTSSRAAERDLGAWSIGSSWPRVGRSPVPGIGQLSGLRSSTVSRAVNEKLVTRQLLVEVAGGGRGVGARPVC